MNADQDNSRSWRGLLATVVDNVDGTMLGLRIGDVWYLPECAAHHSLAEPDVCLTISGNLCCPRCKEREDREPKYVPVEGFDFTAYVERRRRELDLPSYC